MTYTGTGSRQSDNCSFFSPSSSISLTFNNIDAGGSGTLTKTHISAGVVFNHTMTASESGGVFNITTDTITVNIGGTDFLSVITGFQVSGGATLLTAVQSFTRDPGGPTECQDSYGLVLSKS